MFKAQPCDYPLPIRNLKIGDHSFTSVLPVTPECPAMKLVETEEFSSKFLLEKTVVRIVEQEGYCWVDETVPCIILTQNYYTTGDDLDLYLDLIHELTHIRQVLEGKDVWDESLPYHRRPTEIEGYAMAVAECYRLGLDEAAILNHLSNPWMSMSEITELLMSTCSYLSKKGSAEKRKLCC